MQTQNGFIVRPIMANHSAGCKVDYNCKNSQNNTVMDSPVQAQQLGTFSTKIRISHYQNGEVNIAPANYTVYALVYFLSSRLLEIFQNADKPIAKASPVSCTASASTAPELNRAPKINSIIANEKFNRNAIQTFYLISLLSLLIAH